MPNKANYCSNPKCSYITVKGGKPHPKRLGANDNHTVCLICLGVDHDTKNCEICQAFHYKTLRLRLRKKAVEMAKKSGFWPETYNAKSLEREKSRAKSIDPKGPSAPQKVIIIYSIILPSDCLHVNN